MTLRSLGTALIAAALLGPMVSTSAPQEAPPPRLLVWDGQGHVLHAIDPESGTRLASASVPAGTLVLSTDRSRIVAFWTEPRTRIEHATILDRQSLRTLGDVPLGVVCFDRLQARDGRYLAVICFSGQKNRQEPNEAHVLAIDLTTGALAGRLPVHGGASLIDVGDGRVQVLSKRTTSIPVNTILTASLPDLKEPAIRELPCAGAVSRQLLTADRRRVFVGCDSERWFSKKAPVFPSSTIIVDLVTSAPPRVVPLGDDVFGTWTVTDGRFIYIASKGTDVKVNVEPALIVFSTDTERVELRIPLSPEADQIRWPSYSPRVGRADGVPIFIHTSSSLIAIREGRVVSTTALPGTSLFVNSRETGDRRRLYVSRDRTLVALDLPAATHAWTATLASDGPLSVSPDGARVMIRHGDDVTLVDSAKGTTVGRLQSSTKGARAGLFWKDLGLSFSGVSVNSAISTDVAFSATAPRALLLGSTGQVFLADLVDGRTIAGLPDRASALVGLPMGPLALVLSSKQVVAFDMTTAKQVHKLTFDDASAEAPARIAVWNNGARAAVGSGSTLFVLEPVSGRVVSRAGGFGRIAQLMFLD